ncbi:transcriptional activator NhaR [Gemmatimonadota bacterium]
MNWLNYHHLLYFWTVAQEGSLTAGSKKLHLTPQTVSTQLRTLEDALGEELFDRSGRQLVLTDVGRVVYRYAHEIFMLGRELTDNLEGRPAGRSLRLLVGVADVLPKLLAYRLIEPALRGDDEVRIVCVENSSENLLAKLVIHELDVVLTDAPVPPNLKLRAFNHLLGECGVTFMATAPLVSDLRKGFPHSLDGAPFLLPADGTTLRHSLEHWFGSLGIRPAVVGEFEDSALLKVFGQSGAGVFAVPAIVAEDARRQYKVRKLGETTNIVERWYAISGERRVQHPAVAAICQAARARLFG